MMTVASGGGQGSLLHIALMAHNLLLARGPQRLDHPRGRLEVQFAFVGVQQHWRAIGYRQDLDRHTANRRQAKSASKYGDVAGGPSGHGDKPQHLGRVEAGGLRGGQLLGNQDGLLRQIPGAVLDPEDQLEDPLANIRHIGGTLGQQWAAGLLEQCSGGESGAVPGEGRALALGQQTVGVFQQGRVFEQFLMGTKNLCLGAPRGLVL